MGHTQVSELYSSPRRQTQDKLLNTKHLFPQEQKIHMVHTQVIFAIKKFDCSLLKTCSYSGGNKSTEITAGSSPFDVTFDNEPYLHHLKSEGIVEAEMATPTAKG